MEAVIHTHAHALGLIIINYNREGLFSCKSTMINKIYLRLQ